MKPQQHNDPTDQLAINEFCPDDLSWLAFCYVADELGDEARAHFEIRLDQDQSVRDAVARIVAEAELIDASLQTTNRSVVVANRSNVAVPSADSRSTRSAGTSWYRSLALVTSAAALLLFAVIWGSNPNTATPNTPDELAEVWSNDSWEGENELVAINEVADELVEDFNLEFEVTEASWLVAALDVDDETSPDPMDLDFPESGDGETPCIY